MAKWNTFAEEENNGVLRMYGEKNKHGNKKNTLHDLSIYSL